MFDNQVSSRFKIASNGIGNGINPKMEMFDNPLPDPISTSSSMESTPEFIEFVMKLQNVYRSFHTRGKLADCVDLIEQNWWKEKAASRWARVGKGLSLKSKAQKLALQHWLDLVLAWGFCR
ncbi:hypothetical protein L2E82_49612 [Cichorium intybus]|uniref:Uncharacterized protein n=1 Tax=Cichorium intybus TaxID=13427 RepID=A0ACB8Z163_CICIN|nr:hypothetical protein L2E82_49612 [Cichorium intybus]